MINTAKPLLADGTVDRVIGWKRGEFAYDITPAVFETAEELEKEFVFDDFTAEEISDAIEAAISLSKTVNYKSRR